MPKLVDSRLVCHYNLMATQTYCLPNRLFESDLNFESIIEVNRTLCGHRMDRYRSSIRQWPRLSLFMSMQQKRNSHPVPTFVTLNEATRQSQHKYDWFGETQSIQANVTKEMTLLWNQKMDIYVMKSYYLEILDVSWTQACLRLSFLWDFHTHLPSKINENLNTALNLGP